MPLYSWLTLKWCNRKFQWVLEPKKFKLSCLLSSRAYWWGVRRKVHFSPTQLNNDELKGQRSAHNSYRLACSLHRDVAWRLCGQQCHLASCSFKSSAFKQYRMPVFGYQPYLSSLELRLDAGRWWGAAVSLWIPTRVPPIPWETCTVAGNPAIPSA